jgi:hypothetical protein
MAVLALADGPTLVHDPEGHSQMIGHAFQRTAAGRHGTACQAGQLVLERHRQRLAPRLGPVQELAGVLRCRNDVPSERLGQGPEKGCHEVEADAGDLPVEPQRIDLVQGHQWHVHGHAVVG